MSYTRVPFGFGKLGGKTVRADIGRSNLRQPCMIAAGHLRDRGRRSRDL